MNLAVTDSITKEVIIHPNFELYLYQMLLLLTEIDVNDTFVCKGYGIAYITTISV